MNRKNQKIKFYLISFLISLCFQVLGQNEMLCIELKWSNENIKYITGKVIISDSINNFFYGKSLKGDFENNFFFQFNVPMDVNIMKREFKIEIDLNQFYKEKFYVTSSNGLEKIVIYLNEYPDCELRKIQKIKKFSKE
jgi:hypothetical protein